MKKITTLIYLFLTAGALFVTSCSSDTKSEKKDVTQMDSVSKNLEKSNEELTAKTKKVEESLEKIDKELSPSK